MGMIIMAVVSIIGAIIGFFNGMTLSGALFFAVALFILKIIVGATIGATIDGELGNVLSIILGIVLMIFGLVNFAIVPNKDERYVPETGIAASIDGKNAINLRDIKVGEPFYLQLKVAVKSHSFARKLFGKNDIPFTIEIANNDISTFSQPQNLQYCREIQPMETESDKVVYHYSVIASGNPKMAVIDFQVTPKRMGSQIIKLTYGELVSDIHARTVTLEYK
jgi:hypothetical protein